jgi:hypothetical protein
VQKHLGGVSYPAQRDGLVEAARGNGADNDIVQALQGLPAERYDGPDQVMKALG